MALKNKTVEAWIGEGLIIPYGPITDASGATINFSGATITHKITTKPGGGTAINTETTSTGIAIDGDDEGFQVTIAAADLSSQTPKVYYHEVFVEPSSGEPFQLQAPSRFPLRASATS